MDHPECTYPELIAWKYKMFQKVGTVLVAFDEGEESCLTDFLKKLLKLERALVLKSTVVEDDDTVRDLQIMLRKVRTLMVRMEGFLSTEQTLASKSMGRNRSASLERKSLRDSYGVNPVMSGTYYSGIKKVSPERTVTAPMKSIKSVRTSPAKVEY